MKSTFKMEIDLSLDPDISEAEAFSTDPGSESFSHLNLEREERAILQHSILMRNFKDFVENQVFVDLQLFGCDQKVSFLLRNT